MVGAGRPGIPFRYDQVAIDAALLEAYRAHPILEAFYVLTAGHFENVNNNHAINRTLNCHVLVYITNGQGYLEMDIASYVVRPGSMIYIARDVLHNYGSRQGAWWSGYWVHFAGAAGDMLCDQLFAQPFELLDVGFDDMLVSIYEDMLRQLEKCGNENLLGGIYAAQAARYLLPLASRLRKTAYKFEGPQNMMESILNFMYTNLSKPISLSMLAEYSHLSKSHLVRLFNQQTGFTPMQYYNIARMKEACRRMLRGEKNILEIALSLGFDNQYYFTTMFKRTFGYSPTQFIRCMRK